jgi:signal transduction histidine kinase
MPAPDTDAAMADAASARSAPDHGPEAAQDEALNVDALEALDAAITAIAGEASLEGVLQVIADRLRPLVGARYAAIGIVGPDRRLARFITSGIDDGLRRRIGHIPQGHGILGLIITQQLSIRIDDVMSDPRRSGFPVNHPPMHSFLGVPVVLGGRPVGNLYLTDKIGAPRFSMADQRLVETFARQAAMAIHTAELRDGMTVLALLQERERIGRELHDGVIQALYGVGLSLEDVPDLMTVQRVEAEARVDRAIDSIHAAIRDIRGFIFGLHTDGYDGEDLEAGLRRLAVELARGTTMGIDIRVAGRPVLDPADNRHVLQLVREALSNAARHSGASSVVVSAEMTSAGLDVRITDDGRGFDVTTPSKPGHQGMGNMRSRASSMGGTLDVTSIIGTGTSVSLHLPGVPAQHRRTNA